MTIASDVIIRFRPKSLEQKYTKCRSKLCSICIKQGVFVSHNIHYTQFKSALGWQVRRIDETIDTNSWPRQVDKEVRLSRSVHRQTVPSMAWSHGNVTCSSGVLQVTSQTGRIGASVLCRIRGRHIDKLWGCSSVNLEDVLWTSEASRHLHLVDYDGKTARMQQSAAQPIA